MTSLLTKKHNALIETRQLLGKSRLKISQTLNNELVEMCQKNKKIEEKLSNSRKSLANIRSMLSNSEFEATNSTIVNLSA